MGVPCGAAISMPSWGLLLKDSCCPKKLVISALLNFLTPFALKPVAPDVLITLLAYFILAASFASASPGLSYFFLNITVASSKFLVDLKVFALNPPSPVFNSCWINCSWVSKLFGFKFLLFANLSKLDQRFPSHWAIPFIPILLVRVGFIPLFSCKRFPTIAADW